MEALAQLTADVVTHAPAVVCPNALKARVELDEDEEVLQLSDEDIEFVEEAPQAARARATR